MVHTYTDCRNLIDITISDSVVSLGNRCFQGCSSLSKVIIPDSVSSLEYGCFRRCENLEEIVLSNSITTIEKMTFEGCKSLKEIILPNSITTIGYNAFRRCESLKEIEIPYGVKSIGDFAFNGSSLEKVEIPSTVESIGNHAFCNCPIKKYVVSPKNNYFATDRYNALYNKNYTTLLKFPSGSLTKEFIIPRTVTQFGDCAFKKSLLETLKTESPEPKKCSEQFCNYCNNLKEVKVAFVDISVKGFAHCTSLESIDISHSIYLEFAAFTSCTSLKSILLNPEMRTIPAEGFYGCTSLEKIDLSYVERVFQIAFKGCRTLDKIRFGEQICEIRDYAFADCTGLTEVHFPVENLSKISVAANAFENIDFEKCTLFVPIGTKNLYKKHPAFANFVHIETEE